MKAKTAVAVLLSAVLVSGTLAGCGGDGKDKNLTDVALTGNYVADFSQGDPGQKVLFASDGWTNGGGFNTRWTASQVTYSDGLMHLAISDNPADPKPECEGYLGGEARTAYYYGYGDYEVRMKPSTSPGTASTFFVCTGNYDVWPDGTKNPWDEIDIEFLGNDTTRLQFNYFANGTGGHEHWIDLGFDASEDFHNYGFRWAEEYITWFVDGKPVYRVDKANVKEGESFPKTAGRILMNYWCGTPEGEAWMGKFNGPDQKTADYQWVKTSAVKQAPPTGDPYAPAKGDAYEGDWSKETATEMNFASVEEYEVTASADKKSADIVYQDVAGNSYHNVQTDVTEAAAGHGSMQLTAKNNGTAPVSLRINVQDAANKCINAAASQDGEKVSTDLVNGGSFFTIEAGKTAVCEIKYAGVAAAVQLMIDSATNKADKSSGNITVSGLKFAGEGAEPPKQDAAVDWSKVDAQELGFESAAKYVVTPAEGNKSAQITYSGVTLDYTNVEMEITDLAAEKNYAHLTIKNNGTETVNVRVNLVNNELLEEKAQNSAVNKSATQSGVTVRTDLEWGGSYFDIPAGQTAECVIVYEGVANKLQLMIDSAIYGDTATHAGDLTVSELKFASGEEATPSTPDLPEANNKGVTVNGAKLTIEGNTDDYVVVSDETANTLRVAYADVVGKSYFNLNANVESISRDKNIFTVKVKNNGTAPVKVRIDINSVTKVNETNACNVSATQDGADVYTDTTYGGSTFTIAAGAEAVCAVTYDTSRGPDKLFFYFDSSTYDDANTYSGDVTLSDMAFSGSGSYTPSTPSTPSTPTGDPVALTFTAAADSGYTVTAGADNKSATLSYVGKGDTYAPVTAACAELAAGKNTFTIKIKNEKATPVTVRVDVQGSVSVPTGEGSSTDCTNQTATNVGGTGLYTDLTWGGTKITLAANEEVTLIITYDGTAAQGAVKNILVYVDSMGGDKNDHDASVTISGFLFTNEE